MRESPWKACRTQGAVMMQPNNRVAAFEGHHIKSKMFLALTLTSIIPLLILTYTLYEFPMEMVHKVVSRHSRDCFASLAMTSLRGAERRSNLVMHHDFREFILHIHVVPLLDTNTHWMLIGSLQGLLICTALLMAGGGYVIWDVAAAAVRTAQLVASASKATGVEGRSD